MCCKEKTFSKTWLKSHLTDADEFLLHIFDSVQSKVKSDSSLSKIVAVCVKEKQAKRNMASVI